MTTIAANELTDAVREKYGDAARRAAEGAKAACCGPVNSCCGGSAFDGTVDPITANLYAKGETDQLPSAAVLASLGCGNPTALAQLEPGEVVLDLGSGGGIDVILSARRVGPTGKAYGLDMTDDMLALARQNAADANVTNVEFLRGQIESIPLPSNSVDVVISNCVINLSGDKRAALAEAFRVLKPGGRFAVSDVVVRGDAPAEVRKSMELWIGCVAGALEEREFLSLLREVGFEMPSIEPTRVYRAEDAVAFLAGSGLDVEKLSAEIDGKVMSGFIRATKPGSSPTPGDSMTAPSITHRHASIRRAMPTDLASVERLLVANGLPIAGVADALTGFLVAEHDGAIVGVVGIEDCGEHGLLRSTAVEQSWRSRGLGRQLVERAITDASARGVTALYLLTTTAEQYFPKFGFVALTRDAVPESVRGTVEFKGACPTSATVMMLNLSEPQ